MGCRCSQKYTVTVFGIEISFNMSSRLIRDPLCANVSLRNYSVLYVPKHVFDVGLVSA